MWLPHVKFTEDKQQIGQDGIRTNGYTLGSNGLRMRIFLSFSNVWIWGRHPIRPVGTNKPTCLLRVANLRWRFYDVVPVTAGQWTWWPKVLFSILYFNKSEITACLEGTNCWAAKTLHIKHWNQLSGNSMSLTFLETFYLDHRWSIIVD